MKLSWLLIIGISLLNSAMAGWIGCRLDRQTSQYMIQADESEFFAILIGWSAFGVVYVISNFSTKAILDRAYRKRASQEESAQAQIPATMWPIWLSQSVLALTTGLFAASVEAIYSAGPGRIMLFAAATLVAVLVRLGATAWHMIRVDPKFVLWACILSFDCWVSLGSVVLLR